MDVLQAVESIGRHLKDFAVEAAAKVEQELPVVQQLAQQASANPAVAALLAAVHLPEAPEVLAELASTIAKIDAALGAAKAVAQQPAPEAPADDAAPPA
jgi:hypothetical protein